MNLIRNGCYSQRVMQSLSVLAAYDVPYDVVGVTPQHLITALEVAHKVPELRLMLDHMNQPPIASRATALANGVS